MPDTPPSGFLPFQFHKGAIRTAGWYQVQSVRLHFNSIKVRLELYMARKAKERAETFQFHKGAIRT